MEFLRPKRTTVGLCFTFAAFGLSLWAGTAHAQTFVNGGFETDTWAVGWDPSNYGAFPAGWDTVPSGDADWPVGIRNGADTTQNHTPFGNQFLVLCARDCNGNPPRGSVSQTISGFLVGVQYRLNFQQSPELHPLVGEANYVNVTIVGGAPASTDFSAQSVAVAGRDFADWKPQSLVFTANTTTLTFTFTGVANVGTDTESGIDEISVSALSGASPGAGNTPIPTIPLYGLVLTMAGLLVLAMRHLRNQTKRK